MLEHLSHAVNLLEPANRLHPLNRGRVAWLLALPGWDGGPRLTDLVGSNHGTLTNMTTSASGWRGAARPGGYGHLQYDGTDDLVSCGTGLALTKTSPFTVAAWVIQAGGTRTVVAQWNRLVSPGWELVINANLILFGTLSAAGDAGRLAETSTVLVSNQWARVLATYDGSNTFAGIKIYVNGINVAVSSGLLDSDPGTLVASDLRIGSRQASSGAGVDLPFLGGIDDVAIWNRRLSPAEIADEYDLSRRGYPGPLNRLDWSPFLASILPITGTLAASAGSASVSLAGLWVPSITATLGASAGSASVAISGTEVSPPITASLAATAGAPAVALTGLVVPNNTATLAAQAQAPSLALSGLWVPSTFATLAAQAQAATTALLATSARPVTADLAAMAGPPTVSLIGFLDRYPDLKQAVLTAISASPEVAAFVAGRIYPKHVPQTAVLPAICYRIVSAVRDRTLTSAAGLKEVRIRFEVVSRVESQTETITESIRNRFQGIPKPISGIIIYYCSYDREVDIYHEPPPGSDVGAYAKQFDLTFKVRETIPNNT